MKKNPNSSARLDSKIARLIPEILLTEVYDPKIGIVSVNEVRVNSDHSQAKVYVSFLGAEHPRWNLAELEKKKGYVRSRLSKKLGIYKVPELLFLLDESYYRVDELEEALEKEEKDLATLRKDEVD